MNNKKIGDEFEDEFCELLKSKGFWVHFITPDKKGAQPFDVVAAKNNIPYAFDCKTSALKFFRISRLEDNQIMAFEKWMSAGNSTPFIAVKYNGGIYLIPYDDFKEKHGGRINLEKYEIYRWK